LTLFVKLDILKLYLFLGDYMVKIIMNIGLIIFIISLLNCAKDKNNEQNISIIGGEYKYLVFHDADNISIDLTKDDLINIDNIINNFIKNYNEAIENDFDLINKWFHLGHTKDDCKIYLDKYKRQYIPVENIIGNKIIYVILSMKDISKKTWKEKPILAKDGGIYIFNITINLSEKYIYNFSLMDWNAYIEYINE
jgi:hypothetical protein